MTSCRWYSLALSLMLLATAAFGAEHDSSLPEPPPEPPPAVERLPAEGMRLPPLPPRDSFEGILERPLFSDNRRPDPVETAAAATSAKELRETWRLTGIIIIGDETKALLRERNGERHLLLSVGMPLDDSWLLDEIENNGVVMDSGDEKVRLDLLEPRDTEPVEPEPPAADETPAPEEGSADGEVRQLDERTREAAERLQQQIKTTKDEAQ